jgi:hypothetical protein
MKIGFRKLEVYSGCGSDQAWKFFYPTESGVRSPDPQHCFLGRLCCCLPRRPSSLSRLSLVRKLVCRLHRLAGRYNNSMPKSTKFRSQGLRIWPLAFALFSIFQKGGGDGHSLCLGSTQMHVHCSSHVALGQWPKGNKRTFHLGHSRYWQVLTDALYKFVAGNRSPPNHRSKIRSNSEIEKCMHCNDRLA